MVQGVDRVENLKQFVESDANLQASPGGGYGHGLSTSDLSSKQQRNEGLVSAIASRMTDEELRQAYSQLSDEAKKTGLGSHVSKLLSSRLQRQQTDYSEGYDGSSSGGDDDTPGVRLAVFKR